MCAFLYTHASRQRRLENGKVRKAATGMKVVKTSSPPLTTVLGCSTPWTFNAILCYAERTANLVHSVVLQNISGSTFWKPIGPVPASTTPMTLTLILHVHVIPTPTPNPHHIGMSTCRRSSLRTRSSHAVQQSSIVPRWRARKPDVQAKDCNVR